MSYNSPPAPVASPNEGAVENGATRTGECSLPEEVSAGSTPIPCKTVLLLEDDVSFRTVIHDFLTENGYTVVSGQSGVDGILAVLANDFAVVLCDMNMPGLAGDLFFHAVERARPALCERFIFMTGYRGDERANQFIKSVDSLTLMKPFPLDDLLAAVRTIESGRQSFEPAARVSLPVPTRSIPAPKIETPARVPVSSPERAAAINDSALRRPSGIRSTLLEDEANAEFNRMRHRPIVVALLGLVLFGIVAATAGAWYFGLRLNASAASAEVGALERRLADLSKLVGNAEQARPRLEASVALTKHIEDERKTQPWTRVLRGVTGAAGQGIALSDFQMREPEAGTSEMWIGGVAMGSEPRNTADRFRQALERELKHRFNQAIVSSRFERLEDDLSSPTVQPGQRGTAFTIIVAVRGGQQEQRKD